MEGDARDSIPIDIENALPVFDPAKPVATRASGIVLNALAKVLPQLVGGSADLAPSNMTWLKDFEAIAPGNFAGRNFHFGVREIAMAAIMNGIQLHGGFRIFGGTFFVFAITAVRRCVRGIDGAAGDLCLHP